MRIADQIRSVRHTFATNRVRAALTLLGIIIGAGSIVMLAGLMRGGEEALLATSQRANEADLIQVRRDEPPARQLHKTRRDLSQGDEDTLGESRLLGGAQVASEAQREVTAFLHEKKKRVRLVGAEPGAIKLYRLEVERGRFFTDDDLLYRRKVCVVGHEVWADLLDERANLEGAELAVDGEVWTVIGVLKSKPPLGGGGAMGTWMWDRKLLVPQTAYNAIYAPTREVARLFVRIGEGGDLSKRMRAAEGIVNATLLRRHLGVQNFKIEGEEGVQNQQRLILGVIKMLLLSTGLLSLFVGGINIMNIMLVTVTERTREIGIRRAIGAPPGAILVQFLLEAGLIALAGGLAGVLGGISITWLASVGLQKALGDWNFHVEAWSVVLGLALSVATGVVFGLFPAWRASRLNPVDALRYE